MWTLPRLNTPIDTKTLVFYPLKVQRAPPSFYTEVHPPPKENEPQCYHAFYKIIAQANVTVGCCIFGLRQQLKQSDNIHLSVSYLS